LKNQGGVGFFVLRGGETSEVAIGQILETLGLSALEAKAYLGLAKGGRMTAAEIAKKSGMPRAEAYEVLRRLETKGFIRELLGKPARFEPVDPLELRTRILQEERRRFSSIENGMSRILEVWPALQSVQVADYQLPRAATLKGREKIAGAVSGMIEGAQESVRMFTTWRGLMIAREQDFPEHWRRLTERGVDIRMMIDEAAARRLTPGMLPEGLDVRVSKGLKARFYLVDDREVLYHLHLRSEQDLWGSDEAALWTDSPDQVNVYRWLFQNGWDTGVPLQRVAMAGRKAQSIGGS